MTRDDALPDGVTSKEDKLPTRLLLKDGREVRIAQHCYAMGRGFWRVTYEQDGRFKGCLAENLGERFAESDMSEAVGKVEDALGIPRRAKP